MTENEAQQSQLDLAPIDPPNESLDKARRSDQLLVRMNHEVRTAVNVILGLTDVIRDSESSANLGSSVAVARSSAERLLKESSEIIDLARAELGSLQLCSTSFSLPDTLNRAMDLMSILASCKRVTLKYQLSHQVPTAVIGDPGRLSQILATLVRASIGRLERGEIFVNVEQDTNRALTKFSIEDNGPSIPPAGISRLFDFGIDQDTGSQDAFEHALPLARHLARLMGGDLWVEVESPMGACFRFTVSLCQAPIAEVIELHKAGSKVLPTRRPLKILVADDSADTILLIRALLKEVPWGIEEADNGRRALELAVSRPYDLILMDLDMPEMNGYTATRQIRISECLKEMPPVPIVALTAHTEAEAASKSIEAGCTAHVTKPIRKAALIETIQRYAGDKKFEPVRR
jgi:CheY-like chemotaxis protein